MRILYMGTPDFAVAPLQALLDAGHTVTGVVTQPDKPKGRGMKMLEPPVKVLAKANNIPVWQPETLRQHAADELLAASAPEMIVVVAYGKLLPGYVRRYPKYGCINVHGSLLPAYRGAAPIQWSVVNGDTVTGVTTMHMAKVMDTGDMILQRTMEIGPLETAESVHDRMSILGAQTLVETVAQIAAGTAPRIPQDDSLATYAPMIEKSHGAVDWTKPAAAIINLARGLYPWPCAYASAGGNIFKLYDLRPAPETTTLAPGSVAALTSEGLVVACGDGNAVIVGQLQAQGGRRMAAADYFRGHALFDAFDPVTGR